MRFLERLLEADEAGEIIDNSSSSIREVVTRRTRNGDPGVRITREDGSVVDISPSRVKEFVPEPRASSGTRRVIFEDAIPGSKGRKRLPTKEELDLLEHYSEN